MNFGKVASIGKIVFVCGMFLLSLDKVQVRDIIAEAKVDDAAERRNQPERGKNGFIRIGQPEIQKRNPCRRKDIMKKELEKKKIEKSEGNARDLSRMLLEWYDAERRILPWREDPTPYHVWISEIMLQQTRVEAVKEYYRRFLETLPDVKALAEADEQTCLKLWEGLGYYSRVRNLHKAAVEIMEEHGGQIPGNSRDLEKLPGIGSYTAAAIASIAFGEKKPSVDGNLLRVYARMICSDENILAGGTKKKAEAWYRDIIPESRPGDFNQAVMDIGATICLPNTEPRCSLCPWRDACGSFAAGTQHLYPVREKKMKKKTEKRTVFLIEDGSKVFLRKRPERGLLAGLYEFPGEEGHLTEQEARERIAAYGIRIASIERLPDAKHIFSHVTWKMRGYRIAGTGTDCEKKAVSGEVSGKTEESGLFAAERQDLEEKYPLPSAFDPFRKLLQSEPAEGKNTQNE